MKGEQAFGTLQQLVAKCLQRLQLRTVQAGEKFVFEGNCRRDRLGIEPLTESGQPQR